MSPRTGMAKMRRTSPSVTTLPGGLRLAAAISSRQAMKIARFLIWSRKNTIPNPNALGGDTEFIDSIHLGGCASGSRAVSRLLVPKTSSRPPTIALMTRPNVEAALSPPPKRVSPTIPIAAQVVKYPSARAVALGRGLRESKNRMVRRSKGGAIEPPKARTMSPGSRSLIDTLLTIVSSTPVSLSQAWEPKDVKNVLRKLLGSSAKAGSSYSWMHIMVATTPSLHWLYLFRSVVFFALERPFGRLLQSDLTSTTLGRRPRAVASPAPRAGWSR